MTDSHANPRADLHCHTTCSDGTLSPAALVAAAEDAGLAAVAVTDHDTVAGLGAALTAARSGAGGVRVVPGIEVSALLDDREIHILGLHVHADDGGLRRLADAQKTARHRRAVEIVDRLRGRGVAVEMEDVLQVAGDSSIGRPHVAAALVARQQVPSMAAAFSRWLGHGRIGDVAKRVIDADGAIATIHAAGGVAVLAHPGSTRLRQHHAATLRDAGLDGIEIRHPRHRPRDERRWRAIARRLDLLPSGGSDFHGGDRGSAELGSHGVPASWCDRLEERAADYPRPSST